MTQFRDDGHKRRSCTSLFVISDLNHSDDDYNNIINKPFLAKKFFFVAILFTCVLTSMQNFVGCNIKLCNQLLFSNQLQKCCSANHGYCYMSDMMKHDLWLAELQFCNWLQSFMLHPHNKINERSGYENKIFIFIIQFSDSLSW